MQILDEKESRDFDDGMNMVRATLEGKKDAAEPDAASAEEFVLFLQWERSTRDTIDFKKIYVDMVDDLVAGLLLSQIVYWYLIPAKDGRSKLRVKKKGHWWIAKQRDEWYDEVRISARQFDRASNLLVERGLLVKDNFRFNGLRTVHVRLVKPQFMRLWRLEVKKQEALPVPDDVPGLTESVRPAPVLTKAQDRSYPNVKTEIDENVRPITENTTENTAKKNSTPSAKESSPNEVDPPLPGTEEPWKGSPPSAARVFQSRMNRWPLRASYRRIHETVGDAAPDLEFWGEVVAKYRDLGWNPTNVDGMLEWYVKRKLPEVTRGNGRGGNNTLAQADAYREKLRAARERAPTVEAEYVVVGEAL